MRSRRAANLLVSLLLCAHVYAQCTPNSLASVTNYSKTSTNCTGTTNFTSNSKCLLTPLLGRVGTDIVISCTNGVWSPSVNISSCDPRPMTWLDGSFNWYSTVFRLSLVV